MFKESSELKPERNYFTRVKIYIKSKPNLMELIPYNKKKFCIFSTEIVLYKKIILKTIIYPFFVNRTESSLLSLLQLFILYKH